MRVALLTDFPARLARRKALLLGEDLRPVEVVRARVTGGQALMHLAGIESVDQAAALREAYLYVPTAEAVRLKRGEYFWHEIVGLRVVTTTGRDLGTIAEILRTGANDVYVTRGELGEVLIPAIEHVVQSVDLDAGIMTIDPIPGLLPGDDAS